MESGTQNSQYTPRRTLMLTVLAVPTLLTLHDGSARSNIRKVYYCKRHVDEHDCEKIKNSQVRERAH